MGVVCQIAVFLAVIQESQISNATIVIVYVLPVVSIQQVDNGNTLVACYNSGILSIGMIIKTTGTAKRIIGLLQAKLLGVISQEFSTSCQDA